MSRKFAIIMSALLLSTCSIQAASRGMHYGNTFSAKKESLSNYGNPSYYHVHGKRYTVLKSAVGYDKMGIASWYGPDFHGELTSNRERYDMYSMTAASKDLPLPTTVRVTNLENGRQVVVRVNDRGPFHENRLIDLSYAAAKKLGFTENGTTLVRVTALSTPTLAHHDSPHHAKQFIQIGAFHSASNAQSFRHKLTTMTRYPIRVKTDHQHLKSIYRVQIGPFEQMDYLLKEQRLLKQRGFDHTIAILG